MRAGLETEIWASAVHKGPGMVSWPGEGVGTRRAEDREPGCV